MYAKNTLNQSVILKQYWLVTDRQTYGHSQFRTCKTTRVKSRLEHCWSIHSRCQTFWTVIVAPNNGNMFTYCDYNVQIETKMASFI